ncbi:MAG: diguanylate cyclase (GGDEF)-like protein [Paraglaciecola sp.]|jgi:diguanylate cyclase (GGDEF)-like protein
MPQKVLIIEDSTDSMDMITGLIKQAKLKPVCAYSLTQARHIFSSSAPEDFLCAIVNYTLPDAPKGQAIDFTIGSYLPTIVVTELLDDATRSSILNKEIVDYILKENDQVYTYLNRLLTRLGKNKDVGVLVVDASRGSRSTVVSLLRRHNFITYEATDGAQGLAVLAKYNNIKLIVVDDNLPNMSGIEMLSQLRCNFEKEDLAVIGVSSGTGSGVSARFIKSGANDYLPRPYCHEEFFCRIMQNVEYVENIDLIRRAANSDFLTGLPNRRYFFERVASSTRLVPICQCLALIDIDHFKAVNDTYGHDCGDYSLREIAKLVAEHFKAYIPARFGGEEFCVFMPNQTVDEAFIILDNFRQSLAKKALSFEGNNFHCQVSIGLTGKNDGGVKAMLRRADEYLYKAKNNGRNQVVIDPD